MATNQASSHESGARKRASRGRFSPGEEAAVEAAYRELLDAYLASNHRKKVEKIEKAYRFAKSAHSGARRRSGEPYIMHPIAVARIVISELGLGSTSICAALLHDVVEDTDYTTDDIRALFGERIASIVEGLTKISGGIFGQKASLQAENFRKLLLSMSTDIRVVLIKMADRLHNMRTLGAMRPEKQYKIAGETLYIYAPLAHRLGLNKIKTELEDLAFRYEHPALYDDIQSKIVRTEAYRNKIVDEFVAPVKARLDAAGYRYEIKARVKSAYSIFRKMEKKKIPFEEIYDIYAVRVIFDCDDPERERLMCWEIYTYFSDGRVVHPERLRDWTSVPKANGYRALHLTAMGPDGKWIEVQIRSRKMDEIAELGYAAHWKYKAGVCEEESELDKWVDTIKDILANPEPNAIDFLDTIKLDLFSSEIYVFTPKGDLHKLPKGATVLDLAFAVHTQLGMHCMAGKINHRLVAASHVLESGDQVEVIASETQRPQPEWVGMCRTARAQTRLKAFLRRDRRLMMQRGEALFNEFMEKSGVEKTPRIMARLLRHHNLPDVASFYLMLARDEINLSEVQLKDMRRQRLSLLRKLLRNPFGSSRKASKESPAAEGEGQAIDRREVYVLRPNASRPNYRLDECCRPVPGDDVFGFVDDRGQVVVHKADCPEAGRLKSSFGGQLLAVRWEGKAETFTAVIAIDGLDRRGMLGEMTRLLSGELDVNIRSLNIEARDELFHAELTVMVSDAGEVARICDGLRRIPGVKFATRTPG